jgi:hypothetical protein
MKDTRTWLSTIPFGWIVIGIVVLSCISLYIIGHGLKLPHILERSLIHGQEARLEDSGRMVRCYWSLTTFEQAVRLDTEKASDMAQLQHLHEAEAIYLFASGTRVRVLQARARYYQVQIIDGTYAGVTCYVPAAFVQD